MKRLLVAWSKSSRTTAGPPITVDAPIARAVRSASRCSAGRSAALCLENGPLRGTTITRAVLPPDFALVANATFVCCWGLAPSIAASTKYPESAARFRSVPLRFSCACRRSLVERTRTTLASMRFSARPIWLVPEVARPSWRASSLAPSFPFGPFEQRREPAARASRCRR